MRKSTIKPRCVLLDANVVIESHKLGVWERLKQEYRITLPAIVRRGEVLFCFINGQKVPINLEEQVQNGEIEELEATGEEVMALYKIFEPSFVERLDPGETEALALYQFRNLNGILFCTSDAPAIKAFVMLGKSDLGVSFETLLTKIGLTKNLEKQFSETFFQGCRRQGSINLVTRDGLRKV